MLARQALEDFEQGFYHLRVLAGSDQCLELRAQRRQIRSRAEHVSSHVSLLSERIDPEQGS